MAENITIEKLTEHGEILADHSTQLKSIREEQIKQSEQLAEHSKMLAGHDKRLDSIEKKLNEHDRRFDSIDKRLDEHDERFDVIVRKLLDHDQQFIEIRREFKAEIGSLRDEMITRLDEVLVYLRRLDVERAAFISRMDRVEDKCDKNTADIEKHAIAIRENTVTIEKNAIDIIDIKRYLKMN